MIFLAYQAERYTEILLSCPIISVLNNTVARFDNMNIAVQPLNRNFPQAATDLK